MNVEAWPIPTQCVPHRAVALLTGMLLLTLVRSGYAATVEVAIQGLEGAALANVQAALSLARRESDRRLSAELVERLHAQAPDEIRLALQPFGFYAPDIDATLSSPEQDGDPWSAHYRIASGDAVPIGEVTIRLEGPGADDVGLLQLLDAPPIRRGDTLNHRHYEYAKQELLGAVHGLGYLDASYGVHRVEVDMERYSARAELVIDSGPRYVFGAVNFDKGRFAESYLDKYRVIEAGMPFDRSLLSAQRIALSSSGHFREVLVEPGPRTEAVAGDDPVIPVQVHMEPFKPNRYRGRVGWGTETGLGLRFDWARRHFGTRGHRFNLGGTAVQERERIAADLRYRIPLAPLEGHSLEFGARHESKDLNFRDVELDQGGDTRIAANFATALWNLPDTRLGPFDIQAAAGLGLVEESYDVFEVLFGNLAGEAQEAIIEAIGDEAYDTLAPDFRALIPELQVRLRRADTRPYIHRGDYLGLRLLGSAESFGSNISFWQARLSHWSIRSLGDHGRLVLRSALGYSEAESREVLGATFNQMPEFYEFRGGGARNIRGYGFETLFPEDGITGGKHQVVGSIEYEHVIVPDWSAAVFVDGGDAFNEWNDFQAKLGAGLGVRWRSPVGPVRIDVGVPLDEADSAFQLYITVGPEF